MEFSLELLGPLIALQRTQAQVGLPELATEMKTTVQALEALEEGHQLPDAALLEAVCYRFRIPESFWKRFTEPSLRLRYRFEAALSEMVGRWVSLDAHDAPVVQTAAVYIDALFALPYTATQRFDALQVILVFYGVEPMSRAFFTRYLGVDAFASTDDFLRHVEHYQRDAIRLFPTFASAYTQMNASPALDLLLAQLSPRSIESFENRSDWDAIEPIPDKRLPDLGYISARTIRQEGKERQWLVEMLERIAEHLRDEHPSVLHIDWLTETMRRKIDSLLRQFGSTIEHGLSSPLFRLDPDVLERESEKLAPRSEEELERIDQTQQMGLRNLARYLSADHLDVYVATSMRTDADFVSVNAFVSKLFCDPRVATLKLRYFNPTQSWIDDRIAKGLVEALMLRRASVTIYMAQKSDTFGKDSEASVALGQGKPVIVYVPKLQHPSGIDSEQLFQVGREQLIARCSELDGEDSVDELEDDEALAGRILTHALEHASDATLEDITYAVWADFDLYSEAEIIPSDRDRADYRKWLDAVRNNTPLALPLHIKPRLVSILVETALQFERRAKVFREIHPLALQIILSSGVLNGILVVRTVDQCSATLARVFANALPLRLQKDPRNYRLIETATGSTMRVISRHQLLRNAFDAFYRHT